MLHHTVHFPLARSAAIVITKGKAGFIGTPSSVCSIEVCFATAQNIDSDYLVLQVPKKNSLPSDDDLAKEVVNVLSGVDVLEFNIKMLMKHLSKLFLCMAWHCASKLGLGLLGSGASLHVCNGAEVKECASVSRCQCSYCYNVSMQMASTR